MVIKSIYLVPHGGVIVPGLEAEYNEDARGLHQAMEKIKDELINDKIKIIIMTNPHGYGHPSDYMIYLHQIFEGFQIFMENDKSIKSVQQLIWPGNTEVAQLLIQMLREGGISANPLIHADVGYPLKLSWGETIPLSYFGHKEGPQLVLFSLPMARSSESKYSTELLEVGKFIKLLGDSPLLQNIPVSIIMSGDLSHKHDPKHSYGFHENSKKFDEEVVNWVKNPSNDKLEELWELNKTAESCGIYGMSIIQGIFNTYDSKKLQNKMSIYACPTYFGMIVSAWKPI